MTGAVKDRHITWPNECLQLGNVSLVKEDFPEEVTWSGYPKYVWEFER